MTLSARGAAIIAGSGYVVLFVLAIFANFFVREGLVVADDAIATFENIAQSEFLFRAGIAAFLVIFLVDVPGFMVGERVEHDKMLHSGMRMMHALQNATTPTLTVCVRKAFGLAWQAMNGSLMPSKGIYCWPDAEIGFMDPEVGVNVAFGSKLDRIDDPDEREAERLKLVAEVAEATNPYDAAGTMRIVEMIDPDETRRILAEDLEMLAGRAVPPPEGRLLSYWPSC